MLPNSLSTYSYFVIKLFFRWADQLIVLIALSKVKPFLVYSISLLSLVNEAILFHLMTVIPGTIDVSHTYSSIW